MAWGSKKNFSGKKKTTGNKVSSKQSNEKKGFNAKSKQQQREPNGFIENIIQGEVVDAEYRNNGTPFWRARLAVVSPNRPNFVTTVFVKAFNDIARELKDIEEGDIIHVEAEYRVEKLGDSYFTNFVITDIFDPVDPSTRE